MTSALTHADRMLQTYDALLARKVGSAWARTQDYDSLLKSKTPLHEGRGKIIDPATVHPILFDYQRDIVLWATRKGRAAIFADVGLGKTYMSGEWARQINETTLFVAPLLVVFQTIDALKNLGMDVRYARSQSEVDFSVTQYWITNYENIEKFQPSRFQAVVLDESSILKAYSGTTKQMLCKMFEKTPYKLACTATPAPNDLGEIGNHAEFLGVMTSRLMTAVYFTHDAKAAAPGESKYRLKKHSTKRFYRWLASWAVALKKPSDLGYSDENYQLPGLNIHVHTVPSAYTPKGMLEGFGTEAVSATEANRVRRKTIPERLEIVRNLVQASDEQFLIWTGLNDEDTALQKALPDAARVWGQMKNEDKVDTFLSWASGQRRVLITKASIAGAGMNMQHAHNMIFMGINYSWEDYYQQIGRMYRFGQLHDVNVHIVISEPEKPIYQTIETKGKQAMDMTAQLIEASRQYMQEELQGLGSDEFVYKTDEAKSKAGRWELWLGDSTKRMKEMADNSVHFGIHSPPFGSTIYIYSNTPRDLGNSMSQAQFLRHYRQIARQLLRVTMPGRVHCVHIQDVKLYETRDGVRGIQALSDTIVRMFAGLGWIYRARITIQKNPQAVATRNKDTDLLFVTGKRDSTALAPLNTDYLLVFKKPGDNPIPVTPYAVNPATGKQEMTEEEWIRNAHAIWTSGTLMGIKETNTLNVRVAKANEDEKHLAPLQLDLIEWAIRMWSNPGEVVFSPFGGIGSEPYVAVKTGRIGRSIELNPNYFRVAQRNLRDAEAMYARPSLFDELEKVNAS
jgi:DNA modification methylase/superfamily II DNA or RNA helicase